MRRAAAPGLLYGSAGSVPPCRRLPLLLLPAPLLPPSRARRPAKPPPLCPSAHVRGPRRAPLLSLGQLLRAPGLLERSSAASFPFVQVLHVGRFVQCLRRALVRRDWHGAARGELQ